MGKDQGSVYSCDWFETYCVDETDLKPAMFILPLCPRCWNYKCEPPHQASFNSFISPSKRYYCLMDDDSDP